MHHRYTALFGAEYDGPVPAGQLACLGELLDAIKAFYRKAAGEGRAALFTTDETLDAIYQANPA